MYQIPLQASPNQELQVVLGDQDCTISVYQRGAHVYLDLYVGDTAVTLGAICHNLQSIVQVAQNIFSGYLFFNDTLGNSDPQWSVLNSQFILVYASASELTLT